MGERITEAELDEWEERSKLLGTDMCRRLIAEVRELQEEAWHLKKDAEEHRVRRQSLNMEMKATMDEVAQALHPHWDADGRNTYTMADLPRMVRELRTDLVYAERLIEELKGASDDQSDF